MNGENAAACDSPPPLSIAHAAARDPWQPCESSIPTRLLHSAPRLLSTRAARQRLLLLNLKEVDHAGDN